MSVFTQGTELYFLDPDGNGGNGSIVKVECPRSIGPISAPRAREESTCLDNVDGKSYEPIFGDLTSIAITLRFDPKKDSHYRIGQLYESQTSVKWVVGWSDGYGVDPTVGSDGFDLPTTRTWREFEGYVDDLPTEWAQNTYMELAIPIQQTAAPKPIQRKVITS